MMTHPTASPTNATGVERPIAVRAYSVILDTQADVSDVSRAKPPKRMHQPRLALVFDCETRIDTGQRLTVGFAIVLRSDWRKDRHEVVSLICFADEAALSTPERLTLEAWLRDSLPAILARLKYEGKRVQLAPPCHKGSQALGLRLTRKRGATSGPSLCMHLEGL